VILCLPVFWAQFTIADVVNTSGLEEFWKTHLYNQVLDNIIGKLKSRFTSEVLVLTNSLENFF
jgi:hypothetical protein